ncbi:hypothetical protein MKW98_001719 [Papaver atlanticum]|uniref:RING-type E3 ubiquitin transferase n=1 Tax=Papaver atlanticum TaxID=357466 RepID=A0AAD4X8I5_9MAGN|nr:hypothetical protein MKW98_001719 [Papaver atlanticum]
MFTKSTINLLLLLVLLTPPYNYAQSDTDGRAPADKNNNKTSVKYNEVLFLVVTCLVLALACFLLLFFYFKVKFYLDRRNYNGGAAAATTQGLDQSAAAAAQGLKQSAAALQMLPVLVYSDFQKMNHTAEAAGTEKKECAICLVDFRDNDKLTLLPCKHVYHSHCVGTWFISKTTCPLCRTDLISVVVADMV